MEFKSSREIIHLQIGRTGNKISHEFLRDLCEEHAIDYEHKTGHYVGPENSILQDNLDVFFNETNQGRYVPRSILCDLNLADLAQMTVDNLGSLYRPDNIIGNDEGSGNCYAKAFHTEGPDIVDSVLEIIRKETERCHCLQGVQLAHSVSGGTGSGLTGLLLKTLYDYLDKGSKCVIQSFTLVPCPGVSDVAIESYNAALGVQDLLEYCSQTFFYDNDALSSICQKTLELDVPKMKDINNIVALCMSGMTSCLRFPGLLDADLRKIHTNLVPFKNAHFLTTGFAPLSSSFAKEYKTINVSELSQQMCSKDNLTCSCDPMNPGDARMGILKSRSLAAFAAFRGSMTSAEVDRQMCQMQADGSRLDKYFPDWIPNSISTSICSVGHCEIGDSVVFSSNNTCVSEVFDRLIANWSAMFNAKSHLHVYEQDGIHADDLIESKNILQYITDQYKEFAKWDDKFFEDRFDAETGNPIPKESAILNDDQRAIVNELAELKDCYIQTARV